jgi:hypothetical protein
MVLCDSFHQTVFSWCIFYTPFQLLFDREPATKLPQVSKPNLINEQIEENALQNDETAKYTMKRQFDERNHTKP